MRCSTVSEWVQWLVETKTPANDYSLSRVSSVAKKLHIDSFQCKVITVTGTNGKGSCVALLESIFLAAGYRVGAFTSPHLLHFNERFRHNGSAVSDKELCNAFEVVNTAAKDTDLTYFEFTTLIGLQLFHLFPLDLLILEVGIGGRYDPTNIIESDLSIISSIDYDHTELLGATRDEIGWQKAGIMRQLKPVIVGDSTVPDSVVDYARSLNASLYVSDIDFSFVEEARDWTWKSTNVTLEHLPYSHLLIKNAAIVLKAVELLSPYFAIALSDVIQGIEKTVLPGRFQKLLEFKLPVYLDVAHNPQACGELSKRLVATPCIGRTLAVVGMVKDKDHAACFSQLKNDIDSWFIGDLSTPRGESHNRLVNVLQSLSINQYYAFESITEAFNAALGVAKEMDRIIVFGSFYTVATILKLSGIKQKNKTGGTCFVNDI